MPRVARRYVLFLTHNSPGGHYEGLYILTGHELRNGRVFPLDRLGPAHPITTYTNTDETKFLYDLFQALTAS